MTPLHRAVVAGHAPCCSALLRAGGLNPAEQLPADTPAGFAEDDPEASWVAAARRNSAGSSSPGSPPGGQQPAASASPDQAASTQAVALQLLHLAAELGHTSVIDALVAGGVPVEIRDEVCVRVVFVAWDVPFFLLCGLTCFLFQ